VGNLPVNKSVVTGYEILLQYAGWAQIDTGVIRAGGRDRARWLHRIVTADLDHLGVGQGTHAALLDAKGHFVADFLALVDQGSILLLTDPTSTAPLLNALRRYIFREKVELTDESDRWALFALVGEGSDALAEELFGGGAPEPLYSFADAEFDSGVARLIRSHRARFPSTDVFPYYATRDRVQKALNSVPEIGPEVLDVLRIEAGIPLWGQDFDASTLALEIPDVLSVRVDQGCYVGQEVVARLVHRGHVNRKLVGLKFEGVEPPLRGQEILDGERGTGTVTSSAFSPRFGLIGLGYVRREVSDAGTILRLKNDLHAEVVKIPFED
jgi:tRNA-modifying protein YgfZ